MSLELLSNESLLYLFEFLNDVHLFRAFYGLNYRFNALLFDYSRRINCLDFRSISKRDYQTICEKYTPFFINRVSSICFSDDDDTPQQIQSYLDYNTPLRLFSNLRSVTLCNLCSYQTMTDIIEEFRYLPHLTQLCFFQCHMESHTVNCHSLVNNIWYLPKLIRCHFGISFPGNITFPPPTVVSLSLKYLSIPYLNICFKKLPQLIEHTPHIRYLCISIDKDSVGKHLSLTIPSIISLEIHVHDASFAVKELLKCMPNLTRLTVKSSDTYWGCLKNYTAFRFRDDDSNRFSFFSANPIPIYVNGHQWEDIIVNHLPNLKTFQLKMEIQYWSRRNKQDEIDKMLDSFGSPFWITARRWFVRCDWNPNGDSSYVCLYTLPYAFDSFDTQAAPILSKSTSPNENDYWSYDHVRNLHYNFSLSSTSALSRVHFSNIHHLSIELPFNDKILPALSKLDHMRSLNVFIVNNDIKAQSQLQILFDRSPNLHFLRISCGRISTPELALLKLSSSSVRCLDLHGYTEHKEWKWFNSQQCVALCNSPLGSRCEVLRIRVENPMNVLELVYSMPNLRALIVQIWNDLHYVKDSESSSTADEVVQWLQHSLDSTCTVVRPEFRRRFIQLWIR